MKDTVKRFVLCFILVIILVSCSEQPKTNISNLEKQLATTVPLTDVNKSLQIVVDSKEATFQNGSTIGLTVYNRSPHSIYFDQNSFVHLLGSQDKLHWLSIKNGLTYFDTMSLSPQGTPLLDLYYTWVKPVLDQTDLNTEREDILLRIVLFRLT